MLNFTTSTRVNSPGRTRRCFLQAGFLAIGGLSLADLLRLQAASPGTARTDRAIIVLWLGGGPSHLETYDLKPEAPLDYRSLFSPIHSKVPGLDFCELLPRHAALAKRITLLRSVAHESADHRSGTNRVCTGFEQSLGGGLDDPSYYPSYENVANRALGSVRDGIPVALNIQVPRADIRGPGNWGRKHAVLEMTQAPDFVRDLKVHLHLAEQFKDRRALLGKFDEMRARIDQSGNAEALDEFQRQAYAMLTHPRIAHALDFAREPDRIRDKFEERGCHYYQLLMARRLVEAGVRIVNVGIPGPGAPKDLWVDWDDHAVNIDILKIMTRRLPWYDRCVATLLEDLSDRGLDDKVLVLALGEFGRTPKLEREANGNVGRGHWPGAMSVLAAGGGRTRGDVLGETNSRGEYPRTKRYDPHDLLASIYHYLGINPHAEYPDLTGRPIPLTRGTPIEGFL